LRDFWKELQPIFDAFERTRLLSNVTVTSEGRYLIGH